MDRPEGDTRSIRGGDPRVALLLEEIEPDLVMADLCEVIYATTGLQPNCDLGLSSLTTALSRPVNAPFRLFLLARSVGWCAHAMEQSRSGQLIRLWGAL